MSIQVQNPASIQVSKIQLDTITYETLSVFVQQPNLRSKDARESRCYDINDTNLYF